MLRPSCRGISSQNPCSQGRLIATLHWAVALWLFWCLPSRPGLFQPGFVLQVVLWLWRNVAPAALAAASPCVCICTGSLLSGTSEAIPVSLFLTE